MLCLLYLFLILFSNHKKKWHQQQYLSSSFHSWYLVRLKISLKSFNWNIYTVLDFYIACFILDWYVLLDVWMVSIPTATAQSAQMLTPCTSRKECNATNCASKKALCIREKCHCISSSTHIAKLNKLKMAKDLKSCKLKTDSDSLMRLKCAPTSHLCFDGLCST